MIHLICYGAAVALNLAWLLLGDRLSLWTQVSVPVITVLVAGIGVALRLWELPRGDARRRYLRGALWVFLVYYLACGVGAGLCQEAWQAGEYFLTGMNQFLFVQGQYGLLPMAEYLNLWTTIGASGACYGVLLAFGMKFPNERIILLIPPIPIKAKYFVILYGAVELFLGLQNSAGDNVAHFAHLGGMLFGFFLILYWRKHSRRFY